MTTLQTLNAGTQYYNNQLTETTYRTIEISVKSNVYAITIAEGRYNYFFIKQKNHSSFGGKYFATIDMAIDSYKSMAMKAALMQIK